MNCCWHRMRTEKDDERHGHHAPEMVVMDGLVCCFCGYQVLDKFRRDCEVRVSEDKQ